jgi:hypothetical protein
VVRAEAAELSRLVALRRGGLAPPAVRSFLAVLRDVGGGV